MANCINLRERFGREFRIGHEEESSQAERPEFRTAEEPWLQIIPGARGHVFPWSADRLAASTNTRGPVKALLDVQGAQLQQDGIDGVTVTFPVEQLQAVAEVLHLRRRRRLSAEQRQRSIERLRAYRFSAANGQKNAPERARTEQSDTLVMGG